MIGTIIVKGIRSLDQVEIRIRWNITIVTNSDTTKSECPMLKANGKKLVENSDLASLVKYNNQLM